MAVIDRTAPKPPQGEAYVGGPLPLGYALICPFCDKHKMESAKLRQHGFKCTGPECGIFLTAAEVEGRSGLRMMEAA